MSAIKGHASQKRISGDQNGVRSSENFVTIAQTDPNNRAGMDVLPKALYKVDLNVKVAETVDPADFRQTKNPKLRIIKLTGHSFRRGDVVRFSEDSATNQGLEIPVGAVSTDYIFLDGELLEDPDTDDFFHMRHITLTISDDGELVVSPGALQFIRDAANEQVEEDTATPANNRGLPTIPFFYLDGVQVPVNEDTVTPSNNSPLPVKLTSVTGDINITAGDLNVQTSHLGASADSMRIGDGTEELQINVAGEATVRDGDAITELQNILAETSRLDLVDQVDGDIIDTSVNNIPASSAGYLEIVSSLASDVKEIHVIEDIGEFIGLYTGAAAAETFLCVLPQGFTGAKLPVQIPAGTRLSVRNMKNATIATDTRLAINFLG